MLNNASNQRRILASKWVARQSGGTVLSYVRPTSCLSRFALPQPHARSAAFLGNELDASDFRGGGNLREFADSVGGAALAFRSGWHGVPFDAFLTLVRGNDYALQLRLAWRKGSPKQFHQER